MRGRLRKDALGTAARPVHLSTAGPAPGSVEGLIYTQMPWTAQLLGLREVVAQTLAFSYLLVAWHHRPGRARGIVMGAIMVLVVLASICSPPPLSGRTSRSSGCWRARSFSAQWRCRLPGRGDRR
jgi:hypothetical protein